MTNRPAAFRARRLTWEVSSFRGSLAVKIYKEKPTLIVINVLSIPVVFTYFSHAQMTGLCK